MKKLLLITSLFVFFGFAVSCQSRSKASGKTSKNSGGTKSSSQISGASSSATGSANKDTAYKATGGTAIIHGEPNQAQTDSIKKVKTKNKKEAE